MGNLTIKPISKYRARYRMKDGSRRMAERATLPALYRKIAWWMITDKYGYGFPEIHNLKCVCYGTPYEDYSPDVCPLHHPITGYYFRLHKRITRRLESNHAQPETA